MYSFARAAVMKYWDWGVFEQQTFISSQSGCCKFKIKVLAGLAAPGAPLLLAGPHRVLPLCVCVLISYPCKDKSQIGLEPPI